MTDPFRDHIRSALSDAHLQDALDANAERRQKVRIAAYATLPGGSDTWRRQAHAVREQTIAHLEEYLDEFCTKAGENGFIIHHALDARQAVEIVVRIATEHGAKRIAKSKTMLSEEIGLNRALEAKGFEVVETDLGEWIVQLRGERPAHIITPAVHLTRADVGHTFHEKLGIPYTEDVVGLTAAARLALREVFLSADIGITGANFAVAETGQICLITNEGNGRMVATLPPVHITLLGIERLAPTLEDLALLLQLLPMAASGLKSTVYTSLIGGPRRPGEADGPLQRHIILVDNGRTALRASPLAESLLCIRCGACLNACPVFRELGGHAYVGRKGEITPYPGPIGSVLSPALFGPEFGQLARASSLCGACREACPVDIDLPKLLLRVRAGTRAALPPPELAAADHPDEGGNSAKVRLSPPNAPFALALGLRIYTWFAISPRRFVFAQRMAGIFGRIFRQRTLASRDSQSRQDAQPGGGIPESWLRLPAFTGWGFSRDFPAPAIRPFRARWQSLLEGDERHENDLSGNVKRKKEGMPSPGQPTIASEVEAGNTNRIRQFTNIPSDPSNPLALLERFLIEAAARESRFTACSAAELPTRLQAFLKERDIQRLLAWEPAHLPHGLLDALSDAGIRFTHEPDSQAQAGLTGALAGIAETGAIALPGGPGRPFSASLLPPVHIAILDSQAVFADLAEFFRTAGPQPALALISGPSRTADIEMTLTVGVHGPGEVHIFCLIP